MPETIDAAVLGGDRRFTILAEMLAADGHRVRVAQCAEPGRRDLTWCAAPQEALEGAAAAVLPLPVLGADGRLNAPALPDSAARADAYALLAQMPVDPALAKLVDEGRIEEMRSDALEPVVDVMIGKQE